MAEYLNDMPQSHSQTQQRDQRLGFIAQPQALRYD